MNPQEHNMAVLGQIVKLIPKKLIEKLKNKYKIQTRSFSATSHVVAMLYAQLSHALSLNDICDCLRFHAGYLSQIRDSVPPSRNGLAHANASRDSRMAEELFWTVLSEIKQKYPDINESNVDNILKTETGLVFSKVLEHAGVFKRNSEGIAAFIRFASQCI